MCVGVVNGCRQTGGALGKDTMYFLSGIRFKACRSGKFMFLNGQDAKDFHAFF